MKMGSKFHGLIEKELFTKREKKSEIDTRTEVAEAYFRKKKDLHILIKSSAREERSNAKCRVIQLQTPLLICNNKQ